MNFLICSGCYMNVNDWNAMMIGNYNISKHNQSLLKVKFDFLKCQLFVWTLARIYRLWFSSQNNLFVLSINSSLEASVSIHDELKHKPGISL